MHPLQSEPRLKKSTPVVYDTRLNISPTKIGRHRVVDRVPDLLDYCQNKRVLHLGCSDHPYTRERGEELLHKKLAKITAPENLWGLDASREGVDRLKEMGFKKVIYGNAESMNKVAFDTEFDVILAGEIIEHVDNVGLFLDSIRSLMGVDTCLVITTPNAFSIKGFFHSLMGREKVHSDHNYYFSYQTVIQLLKKHNLYCPEIHYYQEVKGHGIKRFIDNIFAFSTSISPLWADGLVIVARITPPPPKKN